MSKETQNFELDSNCLNISEMPEYLRPREYGKKHMQDLPIQSLIRVSQQRGSSNPAFESIKESIENNDIINPPDVAVLSHESFEDYLNFINKLWKKSHHISDYIPNEDGRYNLVIAGHTRVDAIDDIENQRIKRAIDAGYDISNWSESTVNCKIYENISPAEILALQMDENLHEKPSQERTAIAMVETYYYGLENGNWSNTSEFAEINRNKFSKKALEAALIFSNLSEEIREYVFVGAVPYGPIVELGRTVEPHRRYLANKYFDSDYELLSEEDQFEIEDEILLWNASKVAFIQSKKLNISNAKKHFGSLIENWDAHNPAEDKALSLFVDPDKEWIDHRRRTRAELKKRIQEVSELTTSSAFRSLQLHIEVMKPNSDEAGVMLETLEQGMGMFQDKFSKVVAGAGVVAVLKTDKH